MTTILEKIVAAQLTTLQSNVDAVPQVKPRRVKYLWDGWIMCRLHPSTSVFRRVFYAFFAHFLLHFQWMNIFENKVTFTKSKLGSSPLGKMWESRVEEVPETLSADKEIERSQARQTPGRASSWNAITAPKCSKKFCKCPINIADLIWLHYISSNSLESPQHKTSS